MELFIFDLGGVILGNIGVEAEASARLGLDEGLFHEDYALHLNTLMAGYWTMDAYYRHLEERFGVRVEGDLMRLCFHPTVDEAVLSIVDGLRSAGHRVVVGSNTYSSHWYVMDELDIARHFDALYASHLIHAVKPHAAFFDTVMMEEGHGPAMTHFIDDSPVNVGGARAVGIDGHVHTGSASQLREELSSWL